jgi:hypothetical protein
MPRGGKRINAGRKRGTLNKATVERRERARIAAENAACEFGAEKQLATDVLEKRMMDFDRKASFYDACGDEAQYRYYAQMTWQVAKELAPYQSPKLSAVAVGEHRRVVVTVVGGLPRRKDAPHDMLQPPAESICEVAVGGAADPVQSETHIDMQRVRLGARSLLLVSSVARAAVLALQRRSSGNSKHATWSEAR